MSDTRTVDIFDMMPDEVIDRIDTWTLPDVQRRMRWCADELLATIAERARIAERLPHLERAHAEIVATTRITARHAAGDHRPTVQELDDVATVAAADARFELDVAREQKLALNQRREALTTVLEMLRSVNRDARAAGDGER